MNNYIMDLYKLLKSSNISEIEKYLIKNPEVINKVYRNMDYDYQTLLLCAIEYANVKTVRLLLKYNANTNMRIKNRTTPIYRSMIQPTKYCKKKVKLLLEYDAYYNKESNNKESNNEEINNVAIFFNEIKSLNTKN